MTFSLRLASWSSIVLTLSYMALGCGGATEGAGSGGEPGSGGAASGGSATGGAASGTPCDVEDFVDDDECNTCVCQNGVLNCNLSICTFPCGGRSGKTCSDSEYCAYEPGELCGAADAESECFPRPTACDLSFSPVCGCDGETYSNACAANAAGQGVLSEGECPSEVGGASGSD